MEKFKQLRPALAAFLLMFAMALTSTALSFFVTPVCDDLGFGRGSFTIYYSLMSAAGAATIPFLGNFINKRGVRPILAVSTVWVSLGLFAFSVSRSLWMFYLAAALMGLCGTTCLSLCANVTIQQSYSGAGAAGLMGIVMSGSGVGGMVMSAVLPGFIESFGWRMGYRLLAVLWLAFVALALVLLGKQELTGGVGHRKTPLDGMTRAEAVKSPKLYLLLAVTFILAAGCGIQQQFPSIFASRGYDTAQVSAMMSFLTAALAVGKIAQGMLYGKVGAVRGGYGMVALFGLGFVLLWQGSLVYPALVCIAFGMGTVTTLMPTITRYTFGAREYAAIWSILSTGSSVGSLLATPIWGIIYDATSSYDIAMLLSAGLLAVALAAMFACFRDQK